MTAGVFILLNRIIGIFCPVRKNKAVFIPTFAQRTAEI